MFTVNLINIYGPNHDVPEFYSQLITAIQESNDDFSILCGDFNLVQNFNLDCFNYSAINNPRSRQEIIKLKESHNLHDQWRLDLITSISDFRKGRGFWKFNNSLLKDKEFVENVRNTIFSAIIKYAIPVYDPHHLQNIITLSDIQFIID